jgi:hypothetical protein
MDRSPRKLSLYGLGVATAMMLGATLYLSLDARYYFFYEDAERAAWQWQPTRVLVMLVIILLEAAVVGAVIALKRPAALWLRALLALLPMVPWAMMSSVFIVHAPGYLILHILWCWLLVLLLAGMFVVSAGVALWRRGTA